MEDDLVVVVLLALQTVLLRRGLEVDGESVEHLLEGGLNEDAAILGEILLLVVEDRHVSLVGLGGGLRPELLGLVLVKGEVLSGRLGEVISRGV